MEHLSPNTNDLTILHVEDDPLLAHLVRTAFLRLGFRGGMINKGSVVEAMGMLNEGMRNKRPVSLIISDMQLPDGTGFDLIREVKTDPALRVIPVIVLSHEVGEGVINEAYALGANSYLPKVHATTNLLGSLQSLYHYWLENAKLPLEGSRDRLQEALERAIGIRSRIAEFYLRLAGASEAELDNLSFWLDRALNEGNLSNLLAFFRNKVREQELSPDMIDRLVGMQIKVKDALKRAQERLTAASVLSPALAYQWTLELADALDEDIFAAVLGVLFPKSDIATTALKVRAATQMKEVAAHIIVRTTDETLRRKAEALLARSRRLLADRIPEKPASGEESK